MTQKTAFEFGDEFIKNPNFENVTNFLGAVNKALYGINPFEKTKKLDIDYQDEETEIQIQRQIEEDMFDEEYTQEEMEKAEAEAEMAWDAHKETCPEVNHENCI